MDLFYHPAKLSNQTVPAVLGLTASPVMKSGVAALDKLEKSLDAHVAVPKLHRAELREFVNLPALLRVYYQTLPPEEVSYTSMLESLRTAYLSMNILDDPEVLALKAVVNEPLAKVKSDLHDVSSTPSPGTNQYPPVEERQKTRLDRKILAKNTYCQKQVKSFYNMSQKILQQLGPWCADFYISEVIFKVLDKTEKDETMTSVWADTTDAQKDYLASVLRKVQMQRTACDNVTGEPPISDKAAKLIETLLRVQKNMSAILFVQERAVVGSLSHLLRTHPSTKDILRIGTVLGTSNHVFRSRNITELLGIEAQKSTLQCFKSGQINLVIATSVLEEGIDVTACNTVLCYSRPANLKSFIQRRGRARQRDASLVLFLDPMEDQNTDWSRLETEMRQLYEDEMRALQELLITEEDEDHDHRQFRVDNTGALLTLDNAVPHLYHFTSTLRHGRYVNLAPDFFCFNTKESRVKARVILPLSVPERLRYFESKTSWLSEKNAIKDVAFEAYISLYHAGLIVCLP